MMLATDALVMALEVEGWMTRQPRQAHSCQTKRGDIIALILLSQKAAGDELKNQIVESDSRPAWGLRWALLMTVDRGLRRMLRVLRT